MNRLRPTFIAQNVELLTPAVAHQYALDAIAFDVDGTLSDYRAPEIEPTVYETLSALGEAGVKLFIVSNAYNERVGELADIYSAVIPNDHIITPASVAPEGAPLGSYRKPSPAMLRHVIELAEVAPSHTLMVGDQLFKDIISANRANAQSLLVPRRGAGDHRGVRLQRIPEMAVRAGLDLPLLGNRFVSMFPEKVTRVR